MILTDGTVEPSELYVSEIMHPEDSWLVPVMASTPCKKENPIGFNSWRQAQFYGSKGFDHLEKPEDDIEKIDGVIDTGLIEELNRHDLGGMQGGSGRREGLRILVQTFARQYRSLRNQPPAMAAVYSARKRR